jgi:hypothetical protein
MLRALSFKSEKNTLGCVPRVFSFQNEVGECNEERRAAHMGWTAPAPFALVNDDDGA